MLWKCSAHINKNKQNFFKQINNIWGTWHMLKLHNIFWMLGSYQHQKKFAHKISIEYWLYAILYRTSDAHL